MNAVTRLDDWRTPGCGPACRSVCHDPKAHEAYAWDVGYAQAIEDRRPKAVTVGPLSIDLVAKAVSVNGERVPISPSEYAVLAYLAANVGVRYSSMHIETAIWTLGWINRPGHIVRVNVSRLRKKLGPEAAALIDTERGYGYMLRAIQHDVVSLPIRRAT